MLLFIISVIGIIWISSYFNLPLWSLITALALLSIGAYSVNLIGLFSLIIFSLSLVLVSGVFLVPEWRIKLITGKIVTKFRQKIPAISPTERQALEAGDSWWEAQLLAGKIKWKDIASCKLAALTPAEQEFLDNEVEQLCNLADDWEISQQRRDLSPEVWSYIKQNKFWGLIIPKKYGGLEFSPYAHSCIVTKIATHSATTAVTVMVPNSLGPAELLLKYGTEQQKDYYLPRLAIGEEIPCFGLTSAEAGSDANAMIDNGILCYQEHNGQKVLGFRINWHKRYITLAPIATLIGLAFKAFDPDNILGKGDYLGITVAMIPADTPGISIGRRHFPLYIPFQNGPIDGADVFVPVEQVIGGADMIGQGWKMLMEALAEGRGISLPALSAANAKLATLTSTYYTTIRQQFKQQLINFAGVEEKLARIAGFTYLIEAMRVTTCSALNNNLKPAVISGIAKYHMTELARKVFSDAMDLHGGKAIMLGKSNYLANNYVGLPLGITVEGANILTRNLIIFGQGMMRSHPFLQKELQALQDQDASQGLKNFDKLLFKHLGLVISNITRLKTTALTAGLRKYLRKRRSIRVYYREIMRMSAALAVLTDFSLLVFGKSLKNKERMSARLGDILSYLYMGSAVLFWYQSQISSYNEAKFAIWSLDYLLYNIQETIYDLCANFPNRPLALWLRMIIFPFGRSYKLPNDSFDHEIVKVLTEDQLIREKLFKYGYFDKLDANDPLVKLIKGFALYNKIKPALHKITRNSNEDSLNNSIDKILAEGLKNNLINEEELSLLKDFYKLQAEIVAVDSFEKI